MVKEVESQSKDIRLTSMGLGTMGFGGFFSRDLSNNANHVRLLEQAFDLGVNVLDTAEVYGEGAAEETIGKTEANVRNNFFIMSKFSPENSSPAKMTKSLDNSLRRLKRDYIDVYQPHWPQPSVNVDDTLRHLEDMKKLGKIRFSGLSNFSAEHLEKVELENSTSLRFFQCEYNPIENEKAKDLSSFIKEIDGFLVAFSPFREGQIFSFKKFKILEEFSSQLGYLPSQVLLAWCMANERTIVIPKVSSHKHLKDNIKSMQINLCDSDIEYITLLFKPNRMEISPEDIIPSIPVKKDERKIYTNLDDAKNNIFDLNPGPMEIVQEILENKGKLYKPIKVKDKNKEGKYVLVDGRLRFWAWVILNGWKKPITSIII
jgi:diketogulonate reductase-like aldo/keto reductase